MTFTCPHCQQPLEADDSFAEESVTCPSCGQSFFFKAEAAQPNPEPNPQENSEPIREAESPFAAQEPPKVPPKFRVGAHPHPNEEQQSKNEEKARPAGQKTHPKFRVVSPPPSAKKTKSSSSDSSSTPNGSRQNAGGNVVTNLRNRFNDFTGLEKLEGFNLSALFSEIFGKHKAEDVEAFFAMGTRDATPPIEAVDTTWPRPWLFFRALAAAIVLYMLFTGAYDYFGNPTFIPGSMVMGTLVVPFATLLFFYEVNVRRNISLYQVLKLLFSGGIVSLIVTSVFLVLVGNLDGVVGLALAGPVEEIGKLLALLMVARSMRYHYKLNGLLMGAAIGTGFAVFESMGYALYGLLEGVIVETAQNSEASLAEPVAYMQSIVFVRGVLSPLGHIVWTAIAGAALWRVKGGQPFRFVMLANGKFWHLFLIPVILHTLWDVPIPFVDNLPYFGKYLLLGAAAWSVVLALVQEGLKELRAEKIAAREKHQKMGDMDGGTAPA